MRFRRDRVNSAERAAGGSVTTLAEVESSSSEAASENGSDARAEARELALEWHAAEERILTLVAELHTLQLEAARLGITPSWDEASLS